MYPLPVVNPALSRNRYTPFQKVGVCFTSVVLLVIIWLLPSGGGSVTGHPKLDLGLFLFGIMFFFYEFLLANNGFWWKQKISGRWGRKGVK